MFCHRSYLYVHIRALAALQRSIQRTQNFHFQNEECNGYGCQSTVNVEESREFNTFLRRYCTQDCEPGKKITSCGLRSWRSWSRVTENEGGKAHKFHNNSHFRLHYLCKSVADEGLGRRGDLVFKNIP